MSTRPMMKCGHSANATANGQPSCVICLCHEEVKSPDLSGRRARCSYYRSCKSERDSSVDLAFFGYNPNSPCDEYYCGCHGWD